MAEITLPRRPTNIDIKIPVADKNCIEYLVAFGATNEQAFLLFHPEYLTPDGKLNQAGKRACRDFFNYSKNKEYRDEYNITLQEFYKSLSKRNYRSKSSSDNDDADSEERKDNVLKELLNQAMLLVESGASLDPDTLKTVVEIFKKLNLIKDEVEQMESPRRYIPIRCNECSYKQFVEQGVENQDIENECLRCRALKCAQEHGFIYDPTRLLEIRQESKN